MLKKILVGLIIVLLVLIVVIASRPSHYRVERSVTASAPVEAVWEQVSGLERWAAWMPWNDLDPAMTKTLTGPKTGVGSAYAWSGNDKVGRGKMEIIAAVPNESVTCRLEFLAPMHDVATTAIGLKAGAGGTVVSWSMEGELGFIGKAMGFVASMDKMIGKDFDTGLARIKNRAETAAAQPATGTDPK
jgi:uncharacterized protein YndB with AHSA1/START domain